MAFRRKTGASFRDDLKLSVKWLEQYFDMRAPAVKTAHDTLQRISTNNLNLALPTLDETLAALRTVRQSREKR